MPNNEKKVAWITGGSRGIGYACAEALGREGYAVAISARNKSELDKAAHTLREAGVQADAIVCDVAEEESILTAHKTIEKTMGAVDLLVNNAGVSPWSTFSETTAKEFEHTIAVNVRGMFLTSRAVLPAMYEKKRGAIVQMLSVASVKAYKNGAAYVASKFAALGLTNALREEARKHGVRVISVMPGAVETGLWDVEARTRHGHRMMQPSDIAKTIVDALAQPDRALIEEILIRPLTGDI